MGNVTNTTSEQNWGAEPFRAPTMAETDSLIFDECGRILDNTCYRSHYFRLVKAKYGSYYLLVKHGAGEERVKIGWSNLIAQSLTALNSDARYFMLHTIYRASKDAETTTADHYRNAFANGLLKKKLIKRSGPHGTYKTYRVWIEQAAA